MTERDADRDRLCWALEANPPRFCKWLVEWGFSPACERGDCYLDDDSTGNPQRCDECVEKDWRLMTHD